MSIIGRSLAFFKSAIVNTFSITSASTVGSFSVNSQDTNPYGVSFSSDGTKMYVAGVTNGTIFQYTVTGGWNIGGASYASKSVSVSAQASSPHGLTFSADGTKMYVTGSGTAYQYTLSTAWDVSTATYASKNYSPAQDTTVSGISFSTDGFTMYLTGGDNSSIFQYTLGTAWDISTASYASKSLLLSAKTSNPYQNQFTPDGLNVLVMGQNELAIFNYAVSSAWDVSTGVFKDSKSISGQTGSPSGLFLSSDKTHLYASNSSGGNHAVYQYGL